MVSNSAEIGKPAHQGWLPTAHSPAENPHMTLAFAQAYERAATRITAPASVAALQAIGPIGRNTRILDIAAGTGALSIPAAHTGARVTAIDIAPGMIEVLSERLAPFPAATAQIMDGQALSFDDASFDAALSIIGVSIFADWKRGLAEQVRVLRPGGKAVVGTWRTPPGGGPFVIMGKALQSTFPELQPPAPPEGFLFLSDPQRLASAMEKVGLIDVTVDEIQAVWEGPGGLAYLDELRDLHPFMGPYARLDASQRTRLDDAIVRVVDELSEDRKLVMTTEVLLAIGTRP